MKRNQGWSIHTRTTVCLFKRATRQQQGFWRKSATGTCLGQEPGVVDPHTVHSVLVHCMEVAHFLAVHVQGDAGVPRIRILVKPVCVGMCACARTCVCMHVCVWGGGGGGLCVCMCVLRECYWTLHNGSRAQTPSERQQCQFPRAATQNTLPIAKPFNRHCFYVVQLQWVE